MKCEQCKKKINKYEIIKADSMREAIKMLLKKNLRPLTIEEIWKLREAEEIPNQWYDTGTLWYNGKFSQVTGKQLKNIEKIYKSGGRLLVFGGGDDGGLSGLDNLGYYGRVLGVKK